MHISIHYYKYVLCKCFYLKHYSQRGLGVPGTFVGETKDIIKHVTQYEPFVKNSNGVVTIVYNTIKYYK